MIELEEIVIEDNMAGLFDFLGIKELQDPQDAAKEAEEASVPKVDQNQPIFQAKTLAEKSNMLKELKSLEEEEKSLTSKYGDFDPFNNSLEDFKAARAKAMENEASKTPATPLTAPWTFGQEVPKELGLNIRSSVSSTAAPDLQTPVEDAEKLRKDEYEKALKRAEEGNLLATLLAASSQAGKAIAGEGRIDQTPDDFRSVAGLYGKDKRINEALKERADKDSKFDFEKAKHKDELAQKREWMQLQKEMHRENVEARKEMAALQKAAKVQEKESKLLQKKDEELNTFITRRSEKLMKMRDDLGRLAPSIDMLDQALKNGANSTQQIEAMYSFIKRLDNSTVREGEVNLFGKGGSAFDQLEVMMSKYGNSPKIMSDRKFKELVTRIKASASSAKDIYDGELQRAEKEFQNRAGKLLEIDPTLSERLEALDPEYFANKKARAAARTVVKKFYSKSADKTKLQYSDGSEEIVDGKQ